MSYFTQFVTGSGAHLVTKIGQICLEFIGSMDLMLWIRIQNEMSEKIQKHVLEARWHTHFDIKHPWHPIILHILHTDFRFFLGWLWLWLFVVKNNPRYLVGEMRATYLQGKLEVTSFGMWYSPCPNASLSLDIQNLPEVWYFGPPKQKNTS